MSNKYKNAGKALGLPGLGSCVGGATFRTAVPMSPPKSNTVPITASHPTYGYDKVFGIGKIKAPKYGAMPGLPSEVRQSYGNKLVGNDYYGYANQPTGQVKAGDWD